MRSDLSSRIWGGLGCLPGGIYGGVGTVPNFYFIWRKTSDRQLRCSKEHIVEAYIYRLVLNNARRSDIRGAMTHALSAEEDIEAADRRAPVQSTANQYGRKTCAQNMVAIGSVRSHAL
ncbi:hypothetical protein AVEN_50515-1 [Araneus ventricosus]|uniref:Uncharacterized protein n=1 Tax=Araneus ventricosus TaxID=182803 RepID=A0A4Y2AS19_ARAVE|nr:hypothetical protein AVEN_50515-1 [Araneus ventricosus]